MLLKAAAAAHDVLSRVHTSHVDPTLCRRCWLDVRRCTVVKLHYVLVRCGRDVCMTLVENRAVDLFFASD